MSKIRVLLVDDEPDIREVISKMVQCWGYEVLTAAGGEEALGLIKDNAADMVILDYQMPGMDGLETMRGIRDINTGIPAIMFTAYPDAKSIIGTEDMGISAYVPKMSAFSDSNASLKTALHIASKKLPK